MTGTEPMGRASPTTPHIAAADIFDTRSPRVRIAMVVFAVAVIAVTIYASAPTASAWQWVGLTVSTLCFVAAGTAIVVVRGDPIAPPWAVLICVGTLLGVGIGFWSLSSPETYVMQTGPATGASVIVLAYLAVRGRVLTAWLTSGLVSVLVAGWGYLTGFGAIDAVMLTLPGYAVMIMGSLFAVMLRPMARDIIALREARERQAVTEAAARAAQEVRRVQAEGFARRARPLLESAADGRRFDAADVAEARLVEAQLRDGIRARGFDRPAVREAVWRARSSGVDVVLLDDGAVDAIADERERDEAAGRLADVLVATLADCREGRLVARILPPGRGALATITVSGRYHREYDAAGLRSATSGRGESADATQPVRH